MRLSLRADASVGAEAISPTSRDAVLAGRSGLYIVDLNDPYDLPRWLPLRSAWEVTAVEWNPHQSRPACVASTSNQKVLIWNLALSSERAIEHVLHGHRRAVADLMFSPYHADELATASIDTTVRIWDLRQPGKATMMFADFDAGVIQCSWAPNNVHELATSQNNRVTVWDRRQANRPLARISAHDGECNGLEYFADGRMITCSTDRTVKIWSKHVRDGDSPELELSVGFPVWRAIPTPFELGALLLPSRGGANRATLVDLSRPNLTMETATIATYEHTEPIKSADFIREKDGYDIATWCHDGVLRVWGGEALQSLLHANVDNTACKDDKLREIEVVSSFNTDKFDLVGPSSEMLDLPMLRRQAPTRAIGHLDWISGIRVNTKHGKSSKKSTTAGDTSVDSSGDTASDTFSQEIVSVSARFPKVQFEEINIGSRACVVHLLGPWGVDGDVVSLKVDVRASTNYPRSPLSVHDDTLSQSTSEVLAQNLSALAQHGVPSLEFCIRFLVGDPVSVETALANEALGNPAILAGPLDLSVADFEYPEEENAKDSNNDIGEVNQGLNEIDYEFGELRGALDGDEVTEQDELAGQEDAVIDSTPLPKSCGGVWSVTGQLICFFNHKPVKKDRGPLPLDKVFADDASETSSAPFMSDSEDFEGALVTATNWSAAAAQLNATFPKEPGAQSRGRPRALTSTSAPSEDATKTTHTVVIRDMMHLLPCRPDLAAEYRMDMGGPPLEIAEHNSRVAQKFGLELHAKVWRMLVEYIMVEIEDCRNPMRALVDEQLKFEWSSRSLGFTGFLPQLTDYLESLDEIQLLVGMSTVLSSLRHYRQTLQRDVLQLNEMDAAALQMMDSHTEAFFHATSGQITMLEGIEEIEGGYFSSLSPYHSASSMNENSAHLLTANNSNVARFSRSMTPNRTVRPRLSPKESPPWGDSSWLDPELALFEPQSAGSGHGSITGSQTDLQSPTLSLSHPEVGMYFSVEITNSELFEFVYPQTASAVHARPRPHDLDRFERWLPRLMAHRRAYAALLHTWGLSMKRAEIMKLDLQDPLVAAYGQEDEGERIQMEAQNASCALCARPLTRLFEYCGVCSHSMHRDCAQQWWKTGEECPAACGCECKAHTNES